MNFSTPTMSKGLVITLQVFITLVMLVAILPLIASVLLSSQEIASEPSTLWQRVPEVLWIASLIICFEIICVAIWKLLSKVSEDALFNEKSFFWVDVMIYTGAVAILLFVIGAILIGFTQSDLDTPGMSLFVLVGAIATAAFTLLMVVMKGLLVQATQYRAELSEVI